VANGFKWNPGDFNTTVQRVASAQNMLLREMKNMIRTFGSLTCPSPPWDPQGAYRVGQGGEDRPEIQKLQPDGMTWAKAAIVPRLDTGPGE